ncbi:MAG TPA: SDR family oxidoreductase [Pseudonocardiaceae bacterium]|nr:SDR family oxidoreductase [Pseudonocardiaceae bacterium]
MEVRRRERDLVIGISPLGKPSARLCASVSGCGGLGILDLGAGDQAARTELELALRWTTGPIGVRVSAGCGLGYSDLAAEFGAHSDRLDTVVLGWGARWTIEDITQRVLVEVTTLDEALRAAASGADGLIARGNEAGGRVSEFGSFVLLQRLLADNAIQLPVWLCGGIGPHTAAAAVTGGAAGVVLDTQLALLPEMDLPAETAAVIAASDGTDTTNLARHRVLATRRGTNPQVVTEASLHVALLETESPGSPWLPVGQDAGLASRFATDFGTVARSVRAVRGAIVDSLDGAEFSVLAPGSALATALGVDLPVVQGPMTRVSDQAGFAASVSKQGALPFIALALATKEQTTGMLRQTKAALGDRPWGVGILGFAPEEVRAAQLAVVHEIRPAAALIAGGHPGQAKALEDVGISTFLHVASPGLLSQFLDAGARKFVFEGAECGGHVGPRSSFSLWETQLGVIEEYLGNGGAAAELQLLFAGGVHDPRSAAMVSALTRSLARRGVSVGVLMGTGYLFTEEAVEYGAVRPVFQQQAVAAKTTALLETAPGHATRCLPSPFVDTFVARREELIASGIPSREVWAELEALNIGRLRIASKGRRRDGAGLVDVTDAGQLADGLFMAGQVAALRSSVTTVAALHEGVSTGAETFRSARNEVLRAELGIARPVAQPAPQPLDVAIVGMAGVFPGAPDLDSFWANIVGNVDSVTEVPAHRWDPTTYYAQGGGRSGLKTPSKWGGFLPEIPFDALRFGIPPATLAAIEPVQLLALEVSARAIADAGYADGGFDRSRTSVVFGAEAGSDLANATILRTMLPGYVDTIPADLDEQLPNLTEDSFPGALVNVIAGRIANRLDLGGANFTVDAACAASLAALDVACKELVGGTSDMVLCGGADLHNGIHDYLMFSSVGALSATGRCRTFDESADGIALGEGVACVVLKRLADAERDGDRIYAVVTGIGAASDGKSLGLTAPRPEGQRRALERAYHAAGCSPADVGLVEAHGTGTVVGDRTELTTLNEVFLGAGAAPGSCTLGSVKSQIGHTKCAAGLAGLIKSALAVHRGVRPPTASVSKPNPAWRAETSPFVFRADAVPWPAAPAQRIAGVSAFGFGGTNFHAVLRGHPSAELLRHGLPEWPVELFTFRGSDEQAVHAEVTWLRDLIASNDQHGRPLRLRDLAHAAAGRADRGPAPVALALLAKDTDELDELLAAALAGESDPARGIFVAVPRPSALPGKLAVVFPGQGSQYPGMLADLFVAFPELQRLASSSDAVAAAMFPPSAFDIAARQDQRDRLRDTAIAQPALGIAGLAVHHLLSRLAITPDMMAGHSYGELVALAAAGSFGPRALAELSAARAAAIVAASGDDPGAMAAVSAGPDAVRQVLADAGLTDAVVLANYNAPRQLVISGPTALIEQALPALRDAGLSAKKLPVACAFHTPALGAASARFVETLAGSRIETPRIPVWSNQTAQRYPSRPDAVRAGLAAQISAPVRFVEQIEAMYADGARVFFEAGPGRVLGRLVTAILGDRQHSVVSCEGQAGSGLRGFLAAVAQLAVAGVELRTGWLTSGRGVVDVSRAVAAPRPGWVVDGQLVRTVDGMPVPGGVRPARRIREMSMSPEPAGHGPLERDGRDTVVAEFLRAGRELVAAQRDVVLGFLGAPPAAIPATPALAAIERPMLAAEPVPPEPTAPAVDGLTTVIALIAQRTGYPVELIDPDLDLEADLSIDSIKRTELAGELCVRFGRNATDSRFDELVRARTARTMADWFGESDGPTAAPDAPAEAAFVGVAPQRFVQWLVDADVETPVDASAVLVGRHFVLIGGEHELTDAVAARLGADGALTTVTAGAVPADAPIDGVIFLDALRSGAEYVLPAAFSTFRSVLGQAPRWLLAVAPENTTRAAGLRGLFRSIALEYPNTTSRLVEVASTIPVEAIATIIRTELLVDTNQPVVVVDDDQRRRVFELIATDLDAPAQDISADVASTGLNQDSVLLLVGGARGITAQVAGALAAGSGCRIELVGRTDPGDPEHPATASAADLAALRAALADLGHTEPAEIEQSARRIMARREVDATLAELERSGSVARYHTVDVRDGQALRQLVKQLYAEHGRIDAVVYAAGVIEDRSIADKDAESFARVFGTKADGCATLLAELAELPEVPGFVVLFGSIAAVTGNRGQADYAAGNDALERLGTVWAVDTGRRALTVHWGPWAPGSDHGGMVGAELARDYVRRGIELIDPDAGVAGLIRELAFGPPQLRSVVYTAATSLARQPLDER